MADQHETTDLLTRLRQIDPPGEGIRTRWARNPDGEEAAAEIERLRRGWLKVIQTENHCAVTGLPCKAKRCGCEAEREMLADE